MLVLGMDPLRQQNDGGEHHEAHGHGRAVVRKVGQRHQREQQGRTQDPAEQHGQPPPRRYRHGDGALRDQVDHEHGDDGHRKEGAEADGEGLGVGQRLEQSAGLFAEDEDGQEGNRDDEQAEEERGPGLGGRLDDDVDA